MRLNQVWQRTLVLFSAVLVIGFVVVWFQRPRQLDLPSASMGARLPDGVYSVLSEADSFAAADDVSQPHEVLTYDGRHTGDIRPVTYLAVGLQPYVPLIFDRPPTMASAGNGFASLHVTLDLKYTRGLEEFTSEYARVAVVIDGEVVTKHKVREPIRSGRFQITRCADDACQVLYSRLTD